MAHSSDDRFELGLIPIELSFDKELKEYPDRESVEELRNGLNMVLI